MTKGKPEIGTVLTPKTIDLHQSPEYDAATQAHLACQSQQTGLSAKPASVLFYWPSALVVFQPNSRVKRCREEASVSGDFITEHPVLPFEGSGQNLRVKHLSKDMPRICADGRGHLL